MNRITYCLRENNSLQVKRAHIDISYNKGKEQYHKTLKYNNALSSKCFSASKIIENKVIEFKTFIIGESGMQEASWAEGSRQARKIYVRESCISKRINFVYTTTDFYAAKTKKILE